MIGRGKIITEEFAKTRREKTDTDFANSLATEILSHIGHRGHRDLDID